MLLNFFLFSFRALLDSVYFSFLQDNVVAFLYKPPFSSVLTSLMTVRTFSLKLYPSMVLSSSLPQSTDDVHMCHTMSRGSVILFLSFSL